MSKTTKHGSLVFYVLYDHPIDYPDKVVVRRHFVPGGPGKDCDLFDSIAEARESVPHGCVRFPRAPEDDPVILESWV